MATDQPPHPDRLLSAKELADALGRSVRYVQEMKSLGFPMPGDRATLREAREFLTKFPWPTADRWREVKRTVRKK